MKKNSVKDRFKERVRDWARRLEAPVVSITVRRMKTKWASYGTSGRLTFDSQVPDMAERLQDYIIVHEVLHSRIPNHGKLWKSLMRAHLGAYERSEGELKRLAKHPTTSSNKSLGN